MTLTALALGLALQKPAPAADFFPLRKGEEFTYQEEGRVGALTVVDVVGEEIEIDGKPATPIFTSVQGSNPEAAYYRIEGDSVYVVGFSLAQPLQTPYTIVKLPSGRSSTWSFSGETQFINDPVDLWMKGSSRMVGTRDVLGTKREILEVTLEATVGSQKDGIRTKQIALYARGLGLVEMKEIGEIGKQKSERVRKLVKHRTGVEMVQ